MKIKWLYFLLMIALTVSFTFTACEDKKEIEEIENPDDEDDDDTDPIGKSDNEITNKWIYDKMKRVYLWNDELTKSPNYKADPETFFYGILYEYGNVDGDLFSWIEEDKSKKNTKSTTEGNLGFTYIPSAYFATIDDEYSSAGFFVTSVRKGSDAEAKGLKRGNLIYEVDNVAITGSNYLTILDKGSVTLSIYNEKGEKKKLQPILANTTDNSPILFSDVVEANGIKIGYLVYNAFERGIEGAKGNDAFKYDIELIENIKSLKDKGVSEFVLDLRYNPGGYLTSAMALASALVPQRSTRNVFVKEKYNDFFQDSLVNIYGQDALNEYFLDKVYGTDVKIPSLNLQRLYVIATDRSASASEAVIHGLRPYIKNLYHIGLTTVGKDKASITVKSDDKRILWQLQPIVSRLMNSKGVGNYVKGLEPEYEISEWEKSYEVVEAKNVATGEELKVPLASPWKSGFKAFGDKTEALLAAAITHITTGSFPKESSRVKSAQPVTKRVSVIKPDESRFKTIIDSDKFEKLKQE